MVKMNLKLITAFAVLFVLYMSFDVSDAMIQSIPARNLPYHVHIDFHGPATTFYGGGCLISSLHVLTSAANIQGSTAWRLSFGSNRRNEHRPAVNSNRGIPHPQYNGQQVNNRINDIGIIFMDAPIQITSTLHPITLFWRTDTRLTDENVQGMIAGYAPENMGAAGNILMAAHVRVLEDAMCRQVFPQIDSTNSFCAVDNQRSNICNGDQGSPLTVITRDREVLIGIGSMPNCGQGPSAYTRILPYIGWIREQTGI